MNALLDKNKIVIGLSGGVDSTTAALLLEKQGFQVSGMYFDVLPEDKRLAGKDAGRAAAEKVFHDAGCRGEFVYVDASKEFEDKIIRNFVSEYTKGRTPNPCTICNPLIKFKFLVETADRLGAYYIATGHYAHVVESEDGLFYVQAIDSPKDQSYMLYRLPQEVLSRLILPLADFSDKSDVRKIASDAGMSNAAAKDSQEICFIPDDDYAGYIRAYGEKTGDAELKKAVKHALTPGNFVNNDFDVLGKHKGILNYTIGQRKGLGIALGKPVFVTDINPETLNVVLGENEEIFNTHVGATGLFFTGRVPKVGDRLNAKIRYAARRSDCEVVSIDKNRIILKFDEKQRAATPGQSLVIYDGDLVIGGGFIG